MKQFLLCDSPEHAELVDQMVMEMLRETRGNMGSQWSGVYVKAADPVDLYGILWESPVSELFGSLEDDPDMQVISEELDEDGNSDWNLLPEADLESVQI